MRELDSGRENWAGQTKKDRNIQTHFQEQVKGGRKEDPVGEKMVFWVLGFGFYLRKEKRGETLRERGEWSAKFRIGERKKVFKGEKD